MSQPIIIALIIVLIILVIVALVKKLMKIVIMGAILLLAAFAYFAFQSFSNQNIQGLSSLPKPATEAIQTYLEEQSVTPKFQGKVFCSNYFYGNENKEDTVVTYLRFHCQEFYKGGTSLSGGDIVANIAKISLKQDKQQWTITSFELAKTGILFEKSLETLLPPEINKMVKSNPTAASSLESNVLNAAKQYYGIK